MIAEVGEQVLLGAELLRELFWAERCLVVSANRTCARIDTHLGVFYHGPEQFLN